MNKRNYFKIREAGFGSILFVVLQTLFIGVLSLLVYNGFRYNNLEGLLITALLEFMFALTVIIISSTSGVKLFRATLINKKPTFVQIICALVLFLVCFFGFNAITNVFYYFLRFVGYGNNLGASLEVNTIGGLFLELFCVCLIPALCEELLFRGLILNGLRKLGKWPAVLISATFFMLMHGNPDQTVYQWLLGIVLGLSLYATKTLWVPIIIHFTNNAFVAVVSYITRNNTGAEEVIQITGAELLSALFTSLITAVIAMVIVYFICEILSGKKIFNFASNKKSSQNTTQVGSNLDSTQIQNVDNIVEKDDEKNSDTISEVKVENVTPITIPKQNKKITFVEAFPFALSLIYLVYDWVATLIQGLI